MDKYRFHGELVFIGVREPSGVALGDAVLDLMGNMSVLSTLVVLFFGLGAVTVRQPLLTSGNIGGRTVGVLY
jgi:hypothetical protein